MHTVAEGLVGLSLLVCPPRTASFFDNYFDQIRVKIIRSDIIKLDNIFVRCVESCSVDKLVYPEEIRDAESSGGFAILRLVDVTEYLGLSGNQLMEGRATV